MAAGDIIAGEATTFTDPTTGVAVRQLTDYNAHTHHLYFTNSGLWDGGRRLAIVSQRANAQNLYSVELATGEMAQLTEYPRDEGTMLLTAFVNPVTDEMYYFVGPKLVALDLRTLAQRTLYHVPDGRTAHMLSCTADGTTVCTAVGEDLSGKIRMDLLNQYVGFAEYSAAQPRHEIVAVPVDGGPTRVVYAEDFWLNHINTSPTRPDVLTFCHEGPWHTIAQRMWTLNIATGEAAPLRPQRKGERIGHEYWFADGERVGYHGSTDTAHVFGCIRADGGGNVEWDFNHGSNHFHSIDEHLIVGDGDAKRRKLLLWKLRGDRYDGPRALVTHRGSRHIQILHTHPRMFRGEDGITRIVYTADPQGYGNVYMVDVPEFESLPEAE